MWPVVDIISLYNPPRRTFLTRTNPLLVARSLSGHCTTRACLVSRTIRVCFTPCGVVKHHKNTSREKKSYATLILRATTWCRSELLPVTFRMRLYPKNRVLCMYNNSVYNTMQLRGGDPPTNRWWSNNTRYERIMYARTLHHTVSISH